MRQYWMPVKNRNMIVRAREHRLSLAGGGDNIMRMLPDMAAGQALARLAGTCMAPRIVQNKAA